MSDDPHKAHVLGKLLERAGRRHGIRVEDREPITEPWAEGLGLSRAVTREVKELDIDLVPGPVGAPSRYICGCDRPPVAPLGELMRWRGRSDIINLAYETWAFGPRRWDTWVGQCPACRTVFWRIQQQ